MLISLHECKCIECSLIPRSDLTDLRKININTKRKREVYLQYNLLKISLSDHFSFPGPIFQYLEPDIPTEIVIKRHYVCKGNKPGVKE